MSDYFLNLAARVLRPEGNIRPRVPSVFEALPNDRAADETAASITTTGTAARRPDLAGHTESAVDRRTSQVREPDLADRERDGRTTHVLSSRVQHESSPATASLSSNGELFAPISPLNHETVSVRDAETPTDSPQVLATEVPQIRFTADEPKPGDRRVIDLHTAVDARQFRSDTFVALSTPLPALVPSAPPVRVAPPIRPTIREASRPTITGTEGCEAPVPAIHVSIGRVEVRASSSAQTSRPQPPATPSGMTLTEYLRQRAGAAR
jgi:hypothetical protein